MKFRNDGGEFFGGGRKGKTQRGGGEKEMKGRDFGDGWSFLGPTDQEIGNIKSCESKNVG